MRVSHFMHLAERVASSPLVGTTPPTLTAAFTFDPDTGAVLGADLTVGDQNPDAWELLLTRERSMVFNETDPVHITKIASAIGKEHGGLRQAAREIRVRYHAWKNSPLFGVRRLGPTAPEDLERLTTGNLINMAAYPVGQFPPEVDLGAMTSDFELAQLYVNSQLWHADPEKVAVWNEMPDILKDLARKAAEGRAITGATLVHVVAGFIKSCRDNGYDF